MPDNNPPPGWYRDPAGIGEGRYWDGTSWTQSVSRAGETINVPIDPNQAALPPIPGSELRPPAPAASPSAVTVNAPSKSPMGAIIGVIVAILVVVLIVVVVNNNGDSSDNDTPPATNPPATEAPPSSG